MGANKKLKALKHQRAVARKTNHQRQAARARASSAPSRGPGGLPADVGSWQLREVLISRDWQIPANLTQILVARNSPTGAVAFSIILVDLGCLGVKRVTNRVVGHPDEYELGIRAQMTGLEPMVPTTVDLAAKVIREAVIYARDLGFQPDRDIRGALAILGPANPDAASEEVPLGGAEGKPLYIAGPHDNARAIIDQLNRRLGPGGFDFLVPIGPRDGIGDFEEIELLEEDEEEDEES
jgi:hypothetical protein